MANWIDGLPGGTNVVGGAALSIVAASTDSTTVRITFSVPVKDNPALSSPACYSITPSLGVLLVAPEAIPDPNYVDLTTVEQKHGENYTVEVHMVEAA
jgi:hypothetical protein